MFKSGSYRIIRSAVLVFFVPFGITLWLWQTASNNVLQVANERFMFKVAESRFAIQQRLLAYEQVLRGGVGLFFASEWVTRDEWRTYIGALNIDKNYPGIRGVGFSQYIRSSDLEQHLREIRREIDPAYVIHPSGQRAEYTSIIYLEPFDWRNQRAFGYDMFSEPVRRQAMERARDSGSPSVSGKVKLVQETDMRVQHGFLMYLPVYRQGAGLASVEQRRAALSGYVYAPFRMDDLMQGILGTEQLPDMHLEIFDGTASRENLMYDSQEDPAGLPVQPSAFSAAGPLEFNGRTWTLRFNSLPAFDATIDVQRPRTILVSGFLISVLFAAAVWFSMLDRRRASQLARANADLKAEIDERAKLEQDLKLAKNAAEAASRAKGEFLANVSHELRTPLTLILAPLEQINAAASPPADWRVHIERMTRNALLLLNRVNDILDFSKADAGKFDVIWEQADLGALIGPLMEDASAAARSKGRDLSWEIDPALETVTVDPRHLEKIVLNLVSNALKFTPEGGWVRIAIAPLDAWRYELSVADSGIGIPAEKLPELFTRFHQIDTSATRQYGGSGIGLALVKQLSELMGGEAGVESEAGKGARFFVRLPRHPVGSAEGASASKPLAGNGNAGLSALRRARFDESAAALSCREEARHATERPRVLVVDDNADMREYIAGLLDEECMVVTADDGVKAWHLLGRQPFDLVVSDVMMPGLDGLGLAARIKADASLVRIPVILVTARGGAEASTTGFESGADDYIAKPFSPGELKARVNATLRMAKLQAQLRDASREAGMAMLASGVLHNIGNMLCNVSASAGVLHDILTRSDAHRVDKIATLLRSAGQGDGGDALPPELLPYVEKLGQRLRAEREALLNEAASLRHCTEHASGIVRAQQEFVRTGADLVELVSIRTLLDTALALSQGRISVCGAAVDRSHETEAVVRVDRYKVLQILCNLIVNAIDAMEAVPVAARRLTIRADARDGKVYIEVSDTGSGIDARDLPLVFNQGFTTKGSGHGYGLHLSALWARESGGTLGCHSGGPGRGATFIFELPCITTDCAEADKPGAAEAVQY